MERIADTLPPLEVDGERRGDLLVIGWGGTKGSIAAAVSQARRRGISVSHVHLRYLNPLPRELGDLIEGFRKVLVPELNTGQLRMILRDRYLVDAKGLNKVQGQPFKVDEVRQGIEAVLNQLDGMCLWQAA